MKLKSAGFRPVAGLRSMGWSRLIVALTRFSHYLTAEARDKTAITSLRLLTVLTAGFKYASLVEWGH